MAEHDVNLALNNNEMVIRIRELEQQVLVLREEIRRRNEYENVELGRFRPGAVVLERVEIHNFDFDTATNTARENFIKNNIQSVDLIMLPGFRLQRETDGTLKHVARVQCSNCTNGYSVKISVDRKPGEMELFRAYETKTSKKTLCKCKAAREAAANTAQAAANTAQAAANTAQAATNTAQAAANPAQAAAANPAQAAAANPAQAAAANPAPPIVENLGEGINNLKLKD